jgi:phenylacetate-coenzyme A ligase PaaK-like adenylate-forming protein
VKGVEEIQVVQEEYGKLEINVKRNSLYDNNKSSSEIINIIKNELGRDMIVNINYVSGINVTQTGKLQRVISKVSPYI